MPRGGAACGRREPLDMALVGPRPVTLRVDRRVRASRPGSAREPAGPTTAPYRAQTHPALPALPISMPASPATCTVALRFPRPACLPLPLPPKPLRPCMPTAPHIACARALLLRCKCSPALPLRGPAYKQLGSNHAPRSGVRGHEATRRAARLPVRSPIADEQHSPLSTPSAAGPGSRPGTRCATGCSTRRRP